MQIQHQRNDKPYAVIDSGIFMFKMYLCHQA